MLNWIFWQNNFRNVHLLCLSDTSSLSHISHTILALIASLASQMIKKLRFGRKKNNRWIFSFIFSLFWLVAFSPEVAVHCANSDGWSLVVLVTETGSPHLKCSIALASTSPAYNIQSLIPPEEFLQINIVVVFCVPYCYQPYRTAREF